MILTADGGLRSGVFITFSGNCKQALQFYQSCLGGLLYLDIFKDNLSEYSNPPVIRGKLITEDLIIQGSDLVHSEGRHVGNFMAIYMRCESIASRGILVKKLSTGHIPIDDQIDNQELIELSDQFGVRWIFSID